MRGRSLRLSLEEHLRAPAPDPLPTVLPHLPRSLPLLGSGEGSPKRGLRAEPVSKAELLLITAPASLQPGFIHPGNPKGWLSGKSSGVLSGTKLVPQDDAGLSQERLFWDPLKPVRADGIVSPGKQEFVFGMAQNKGLLCDG